MVIGAGISKGKPELKIGVKNLPQPSVVGAKVRSPSTIEVFALQDTLNYSLQFEVANYQQALKLIETGEIAEWFGVKDTIINSNNVMSSSTGYSASPMAIMRTDSNIKKWEELSGRTVCLAADGRHVGEIATRFNANEKVYPSITDALIGTRTGECDAIVHDEEFLRTLIKHPEWKKFSASISPYTNTTITRLYSKRKGIFESVIRNFQISRMLKKMNADHAREVAFEVYLDQTVADCH